MITEHCFKCNGQGEVVVPNPDAIINKWEPCKLCRGRGFSKLDPENKFTRGELQVMYNALMTIATAPTHDKYDVTGDEFIMSIIRKLEHALDIKEADRA